MRVATIALHPETTYLVQIERAVEGRGRFVGRLDRPVARELDGWTGWEFLVDGCAGRITSAL